MGIFRGKATDPVAKLRAKCEKKGISVDGLVTGAHTFDEQDIFVLVFPDRVDVVRLKKIGAILGSGEGTETYPLASISSASVRSQGVWRYLKITGSGFDEEIRGGVNLSDVRDAILRLKRELVA